MLALSFRLPVRRIGGRGWRNRFHKVTCFRKGSLHFGRDDKYLDALYRGVSFLSNFLEPTDCLEFFRNFNTPVCSLVILEQSDKYTR